MTAGPLKKPRLESQTLVWVCLWLISFVLFLDIALVSFVNLSQPRVTKEGSLSQGITQLKLAMSVEDCLD